MNIFIDVRLCSYGYQGVKTYIENILPYFLKSGHTFFLAGFRSFLDNYKNCESVKPIYFETPINSIEEQIYGIKIKKRIENIIDIYYFPYPSIPLTFLNKNFVVKLHDVTPYKFWYFYNPIKVILGYFITKIIAKKARRIIAVSNTTADDIIRYFNIPNYKIAVIYDGISDNFKQLSEYEVEKFKKKYKLDNFLIYVGNREASKNIFKLLESIKKIREENFDLNFVIVGRYFKKYLNMDKKILSYGDWVKIFYNISLEDLVKFYNAAKIYVHPALNEGFGLPLLEAMKCGCICAVSDIPIFREHLGEDGIYFNPYSVDDITSVIKRVLTTNESEIKDLKEKNIMLAKKYSWETSANNLLKILEECGG